VLDLFDTDPPLVRDGFGYEALTNDPRGRLDYARFIQEL
jgi:hypothetical protein